MKKPSLLVALALLFFGSGALGADTWITDPTSNAWRNTEEVENFLNEIGENELALYLNAALNRNHLYYTPNFTEWFGGELRGLTNGTTYTIGFSDDVVSPDTFVSFTLSPTERELSRAALYFAIATHELIHLRDLKPPNRFSSERDTYERAFHIYLKALQYLLGKFKEFDEAGNPLAEHYRIEAIALGGLIHQEMTVYEEGLYGEITNAFFPFPLHDGCVRNLNVPEAGHYALMLASQLRRKEHYAQTIAGFDRSVRYQYSARGGDCLSVATAVPVAESTMAAGVAGPFLRQKIIDIDQMPEHHMLRITKRGSQRQHVDIRVLKVVDGEAHPIATNVVDSMDHFQDTRVIAFPSGAGRVLVVLSEDVEGAFPTNPGELEVQFTHIWTDERQEVREAPIFPRGELTPAKQAAFGYFPVVLKSGMMHFSADSPIDPAAHERQLAGVTFHATAGMQVRISFPEFDERLASLFRKGEVDPQTGLVRLIRLGPDYYQPREYSIREDGDYLFLASRLLSQRVLRGAEARIEFGFREATATGQDATVVRELTAEEFAAFGAHPPARKTVLFHGLTSELPAGLNPMRPFYLVDLDLKKGDLARVKVDSQGNVFSSTIVEYTGAKFETRTWSADLEIEPRTDNPHFLLIEGDIDFSYVLSGRVGVEIRRSTRTGPDIASPRLLTQAEILSRYGYRPLIIKRFAEAALTATHPRGFSLKDSFFQLYGFEATNPGRVRLFKPQLGISRRMFLCRVDEAAWQAGGAALTAVIAQSDLDYFTASRDLEPGRYVLAVETGWQAEPGETPFELEFGFGKSGPEDVAIRAFTAAEMQDPRNRLK